MFDGIITNTVVKTVLNHLTDGDTGSTWIGTIASGLIASNINWGDFVSTDHTKQATVIGLTIAAVIQLVWGIRTGSKDAQFKKSLGGLGPMKEG
jgi:hypothetical protein